MVATFNNYQELVDRALIIEGKQLQIILELSRSLVLPRTREDLFSIHMEEEVCITIVAPRMRMEMEEAAARTVPTQQCPPRRI